MCTYYSMLRFSCRRECIFQFLQLEGGSVAYQYFLLLHTQKQLKSNINIIRLLFAISLIHFHSIFKVGEMEKQGAGQSFSDALYVAFMALSISLLSHWPACLLPISAFEEIAYLFISNRYLLNTNSQAQSNQAEIYLAEVLLLLICLGILYIDSSS